MTSWTPEQRAAFMKSINELWPNCFSEGLAGKDAKIWVEVAQRYQPAIAAQALSDLFEGQDKRKIPTVAAFRSAANQVQAFIDGTIRRRAEVAASQAETFSPQEIAMDDAFWEPIFDRATSPGHLDEIKRIRKLMSGGAGGVEIASYLGDLLTFKAQKEFRKDLE